MAAIEIEGSVTPSVMLSTGERRVVERTDFIETLLRKGYVVEVKPKAVVPQQDSPASAGSAVPEGDSDG